MYLIFDTCRQFFPAVKSMAACGKTSSLLGTLNSNQGDDLSHGNDALSLPQDNARQAPFASLILHNILKQFFQADRRSRVSLGSPLLL